MFRQILSQQVQLIRPMISSKNIFLSCSTLHAENVTSEASLKSKLVSTFPKATSIEVEDISGGCGAMYQIYVETSEFADLSKVKQHQLINKILKEEIKSMHGIRINTAVPSKSKAS